MRNFIDLYKKKILFEMEKITLLKLRIRNFTGFKGVSCDFKGSSAISRDLNGFQGFLTECVYVSVSKGGQDF